MIHKKEILVEGSYSYLERNTSYSQENFKLVYFPEQHSYKLFAEIDSRIETGEFLKVLVQYEMNQHFAPAFVRIERSIGNKYAQEIYKIDSANLELHYTFQNSQMNQEFNRNISAKHYIATPAVSSSALFSLTKKFDVTGRTPVTLISSDNDWSYKAPPAEKIIYAEYKSRDMTDYKLNNHYLTASHMSLYEFDSALAAQEVPVDLYISKHFGIPYQLIHGDQNIVIKQLKRIN